MHRGPVKGSSRLAWLGARQNEHPARVLRASAVACSAPNGAVAQVDRLKRLVKRIPVIGGLAQSLYWRLRPSRRPFPGSQE